MVKAYGVEIKLKYIILCRFFASKGLFKLRLIFHGKVLFLYFTGYPLVAGEHLVFDELLGDRACSLGEVPLFYVDYKSPYNTFGVDSVMLVKSFVLYGDDGVLEILRYKIKGHILTVLLAVELVYFHAVIIVNNGCIIAWNDIGRVERRRAFYYAVPCAYAKTYGSKDEYRQYQQEYTQAFAFPFFLLIVLFTVSGSFRNFPYAFLCSGVRF